MSINSKRGIYILSLFFICINFFDSYSQDLAINEIMSSNDTAVSDEDGDFEDWIELYNYGNTAINLSGYGLSDDGSSAFKWSFPSVTIQPKAFLLVWASSKDRAISGQQLHTNFKIKSGGEAIFLTTPGGTEINTVAATSLLTDVSYGRKPDGTGAWLFFDPSTPGASNSNTTSTTQLTPPTFSHKSGLYTNGFNLELSTDVVNATIVYTFDGSEPELTNVSGTSFNYKNKYAYDVGSSEGALLSETYSSNIYSSPITISDRSNQADKLANKNAVQGTIYVPSSPVRKATVVKARIFLNGKGSATVAKTFFVWSGGNPYNMPVISLQTQENNLFDYNDGVYTAGVDFDTWRQNNPSNNQAYRPEFSNYWRTGSAWEYPTSVEFFEPTSLNPVMNTFGGFRIHGNNSRAQIIKNLRLYARSDYDKENNFKHTLFEQKIPGSPSPYNDKFKRLILRGNGSGGYIANDVVFNRLMQPIFNGVTRIQPAVHFINGEFWGLTSFRDRIDRHHFVNNFDLEEDNVVIVDCKLGKCELDEGVSSDYSSYTDLRDYIINNDMNLSANYTYIEGILDIESFINHALLSIFSEDNSYEIKYWKARTKVNDGFGDGKWRLTTQDFEATLNSNVNWLVDHTNKVGAPDTFLLAHLLDNDAFKVRFINRMADVLNTAFKKERFDAIVNTTFDEVNPVLSEDAARAPRDRFYNNSDKLKLLDWIENRATILKGQMNTLFSISGNSDLTLNVSDTQAGYIKLNTIDVKSTTTGVDDNPYPWTGAYFNGIPVKLEAIANPGYVFSHWSGDQSGTNSILEVTPSSTLQIQANYTATDNFSHLIYYWLHDDNLLNDTPLSNLNATYSRNSAVATLNYSSSLSGYPFTNANANWRKASLERVNKPTALNYREIGNNDITYSKEIVKGIQIKQPFKSAGLENTIELNFSTSGFKDVKLSFAISSNGAAQSVLVDYWNGSSWTNSNMSNPTLSITDVYDVKEFDFSSVSIADNNAAFKVRIRFNGTNMTVDEGKQVFINNIAVEGVETTLATDQITSVQGLGVYPNPTSDVLKINAGEIIEKVAIYNVFGQLVYTKSFNSENLTIDMNRFSDGIYLLKVFSNNASTTKKIIKK